MLQILHSPGVFLSICVGHSQQRFGASFLLLVLVGEDHPTFQSFLGQFSHLTSYNFGFEGEFVCNHWWVPDQAVSGTYSVSLVDHRKTNLDSVISRLKMLPLQQHPTYYKRGPLAIGCFFLLQEKIIVRWSMLSTPLLVLL